MVGALWVVLATAPMVAASAAVSFHASAEHDELGAFAYGCGLGEGSSDSPVVNDEMYLGRVAGIGLDGDLHPSAAPLEAVNANDPVDAGVLGHVVIQPRTRIMVWSGHLLAEPIQLVISALHDFPALRGKVIDQAGGGAWDWWQGRGRLGCRGRRGRPTSLGGCCGCSCW